MRIGVVSVQGAFHEHRVALAAASEHAGIEADVVEVRRLDQAEACDGFVLPGGESTAIYKLLVSSGLFDHLRERIEASTPVLATCAGAILLSSKGDEQVARTGTKLLGALDAAVDRNAFGRQRESFEAGLAIPALGEAPFPGVFIRAPAFREVWGRAKPWATLPDGQVVGVRQEHLLALTFHPELAPDPRIHAWFLDLVQDA
ncbi:MAG: pyridoxal 5'-phosphate synthase glutaminase subunit PdxT [Candidatus Thermoplasmatota archaeon]|nr:pyridoxal 5'-phosphate synthase glutaminase subunit PdxT [Candidatus Thermoplasmatota archaeon]